MKKIATMIIAYLLGLAMLTPYIIDIIILVNSGSRKNAPQREPEPVSEPANEPQGGIQEQGPAPSEDYVIYSLIDFEETI